MWMGVRVDNSSYSSFSLIDLMEYVQCCKKGSSLSISLSLKLHKNNISIFVPIFFRMERIDITKQEGWDGETIMTFLKCGELWL